MKVKSLDNGNRSFLFFSIAIVGLLAASAAVFGYVYNFSSIDTYRNILLLLILATIITAVIFLPAIFAVYLAHRKKHIRRAFLWPVKIGLRILLPFITFVSGFLGYDRDNIRKFYIEVNNIYVHSVTGIYKPADVLLLLPHCLQDSQCGYKITGRIENCHKCGKCSIGEISRIVEQTGIHAVVVTGGTAARNLVKEIKPRMILSVACERDLMVGIADVGSIPAIGVLNERPNGPCTNTTVNVGDLRDKLFEIIGN